MRALLWGLLIAAGLWAGYWWVGSTAMQRGTENWFAAQSAPGLVAQAEDIAVRGFPNRFDLTVTGLNLADPASGIGWSAPFVQVFTMTWKPWHLIAAFAPEQSITLPGQSLSLTSTGLRGSLQLHAGTDLALYQIIVAGNALGLRSSLGWSVAADHLAFSTQQDAAQNTAHRLGLSLLGLAPDAAVLAALAGQPGLTAKLQDIHLDATAQLSAPLDRHAAQTAPVLQSLDLREARLLWGSLKLTAKGKLAAGPDGLAEGEIALRIEGWRQVPAVLVATGLVLPGVAKTVERAMEVLAEGGKDPETLEVTLKMAAGQMRLGPIPLGPAPRLQ